MNVAAGVTQHAQSKNEACTKPEQPNTWEDFCMLIGVFGIYSQFFDLYDLDIKPWRKIFLKSASTKDTISKVGYGTNAEPMEYRVPKVTGTVDILSGPTLARPYPYRRFYIKIDWSKYGMVAVILQADVSE